ncbi:PIG-L deacetylase family protein [Hymenobacter lapidiphilus]|uniref:PIG-L family deacetylase n=1 Tax=Hymenobacter lapidiphilus TaxID=2608003 RepID=A0A7Y7PRI6_9BACT|nr:PIG-L family deacetylase [Hymenobacter lapidiphilus]NVO32557.1 PIG-L family deacetylase [Hymenobacter lapidiphilus]
MLALVPAAGLRLLCLGAHADDIEIGAGGTLLRWLRAGRVAALHWVVWAATDERAREAQASAALFLATAPDTEATVTVHRFTDGSLAADRAPIKQHFEQLKDFNPNLILTHYQHDLHQDHRLVSELTWNTFRSHLILEYEIPKYDGDLGNPAAFVELTAEVLAEKLRLLRLAFPTQTSKHWYDDETFRALPRLRGIQSATRYAEAFYLRKLLLG